MKHSVKGLADVTKYNPNFLTIIQGPTECVIEVDELVDDRITRGESWLDSSNYLTSSKKIIYMFKNTFLKHFTDKIGL